MARPTREELADDDPDLMFADDFDAAILGIVERGEEPPFVLYDARRCVQVLMRGGMARDEAEEHLSENFVNEWVGERTPGFVWIGSDDDEDD